MTHSTDSNITMTVGDDAIFGETHGFMWGADRAAVAHDAPAGWSLDMGQAPRDGSLVILAIGGKVIRSYWCKPQIDPEHWCYLTHLQEPEAWMPWPEYPAMLKARGP